MTSEHPTARYTLRLPKLRLLVSHLDVCSLSCSDIILQDLSVETEWVAGRPLMGKGAVVS